MKPGELSDSIVEILRDLVDFSDQAQRLVARGYAEFERDEFLRLASEAVIHRLGEAVKRLPETFIAEYPDVSWRAMRGTRNIVSHNYNAIDHKIIWRALSQNLPQDAARIRQLLDEKAER